MASAAIQTQITYYLEAFRFNEAGLRAILNGPVQADLIKRGIRVEAAAKRNASQPPPSIPGMGPAVRTGRLRGSITWRVGADTTSPYVDVGSAVYYAAFVELGTTRMAARPYLRPALESAR